MHEVLIPSTTPFCRTEINILWDLLSLGFIRVRLTASKRCGQTASIPTLLFSSKVSHRVLYWNLFFSFSTRLLCFILVHHHSLSHERLTDDTQLPSQPSSPSSSIASFRRPLQWPSRMPLSSPALQGHNTQHNIPSGVCFLATYHPLGHRAEGSAGESVLLSLGQYHRDTFF